MKLDIDKAAIEYIKQKGSIINIELVSAKNCWVGISEPTVSFGKPKVVEKFDEYTIDGITVYISNIIESTDDSLTIKLSKFLWIKKISVYGVRM